MDTGPVETSPRKTKLSSPSSILHGQTVHVPDRPANGHRKAGSHGPVTHETNPMAPQEQLESTRVLGEGNTATRISAPPPSMVVGGEKCPARATLTPSQTRSSDVYRRIKRRLGRSLKRAHHKGLLVASRKRHAHKLPRVKSGFPGSASLSRTLFQPDPSGSNRQHYSSVVHKQGRGDEVGPSMRSAVENSDLVFQLPGSSPSPVHPRPTKCSRRQAFQTGSNHSNGMVPSPRNLPGPMQEMAPSTDRSVRYQIQQLPQFVSPVPDPLAIAVDALSLSWENLDAYAFPPTAILGKVVQEKVLKVRLFLL